jgi:DNA-directed RNA polymerase specialized sigma24 family protein
MSHQTVVLTDPTADLKRIQEQLDSLQAMLEKVIMTPKPEWLTVREYAKHMSRTVRTVEQWIAAGKVETKMVGTVKMVRVKI